METPLCSILLFTRLALSGGVSECGSLLQCPLLSVPRWLQWDKQQLPLKNVHWFKLISAANICRENCFVHILKRLFIDADKKTYIEGSFSYSSDNTDAS